MGIKFFYKWLIHNFGDCINGFTKSACPNMNIDTFLIDMNGIFHNSAQRVFQYGNYAQKSLLRHKPRPEFNEYTQRKCFEDIVHTVENLFQMVNPRKTLVLAIDGVAPASKINQQRQRRFRSVADTTPLHTDFNPIAITPGTRFMDKLSRYIDWYIRKRISECDKWASVKVVFSNEKQPGEGEHKLIDYIRQYGTDDETFCINALDADLVMLALATRKPNFYLLRGEMYSHTNDYSFVSISMLRERLQQTLFWEGCDNSRLIVDFILICFLCGNDFLPHIPSISIIENGLDAIIRMYKSTCLELKSHLVDDNNRIIVPLFKQFMQNIGNCEYGMLIQKIANRNEYIADPLLEKHATISTVQVSDGTENAEQIQQIDIDLEQYKSEYYKSKRLGHVDDASKRYIVGCQWVLTYYTTGVSDWTWVYPHNYAPFASEIASSSLVVPEDSAVTYPLSAFEQLLCVIPPKCADLLPAPLDSVLVSQLKRFCPETIVINCDGKKYEYEGVVELPAVDINFISRVYNKSKHLIDHRDMRRNAKGKMFEYSRYDTTVMPDTFKSMFGDIRQNRANQTVI